jgi:hypothetical protein
VTGCCYIGTSRDKLLFIALYFSLQNFIHFWTQDLLLSSVKILHQLLILGAPSYPSIPPGKVFLPADKMLARLVSVATPVRRPMLVDPNRIVSCNAANCDCVSQGDFVHYIVLFCDSGGHVVTVESVVVAVV